MWVTRGYLVGLTGHCLLEVAARAFYAQQNARIPLFAAVVNILLYISIGSLLFKPLGAPGISLTDALAFTAQAVFLLFMLAWQTKPWFQKALGSIFLKRVLKNADGTTETGKFVFPVIINPGSVLLRSVLAGLLGALLTYGSLQLFTRLSLHPVIAATVSILIGVAAALPFVLKEARTLLRL